MQLFHTPGQSDIRAIYSVRYDRDSDWFSLWALLNEDPTFLEHPPRVDSKVRLEG